MNFVLPRYYQNVLVAEVGENEYVILGYYAPKMVSAFSLAKPNEYIIRSLSETNQGGLNVTTNNTNLISSQIINFMQSDIGERTNIYYANSSNVYIKDKVHTKL